MTVPAPAAAPLPTASEEVAIDVAPVFGNDAASPVVSTTRAAPVTPQAAKLGDNRQVVSLSLAGKLGDLSTSVLGAFTPRSSRSSASSTPREPVETLVTTCLVIEPGFEKLDASVPDWKKRTHCPTGVVMEGATVHDINGMLVSSFAACHDWALQVGDIVTEVEGQRYESDKTLADYIHPTILPSSGEITRRTFQVVVKRWIVPPRYPITARLSKSIFSTPYPDSEDAREDALFEHEMKFGLVKARSGMGPYAGMGPTAAAFAYDSGMGNSYGMLGSGW